VASVKVSWGLAMTAALIATALTGCQSDSTPTGTAGAHAPVRIAAVGDMNGVRNTSPTSASGKTGASIAAQLRSGRVDAFLGLGDFQYSTARCYDYVHYWKRLWGDTKSKLYWVSAPNHDWKPGRNTDLDNFMNGQCRGDTTKSMANRAKGWIWNGEPYSFNRGNWHFAMLSSALWRYYPAQARRATAWLDRDLAAAKRRGKHLVVAYHEPFFTSKTPAHTREVNERPWVKVIDKYDVRLTLSGSQHNYERSCPVRANNVCTADAGPGTTAFQVSTGGAGLRKFTSSPRYIVKRFSNTHGWLKLTLRYDGSFYWRFMPVSGPGRDTGSRPAPR
jgi:acid phosphatase type 7